MKNRSLSLSLLSGLIALKETDEVSLAAITKVEILQFFSSRRLNQQELQFQADNELQKQREVKQQIVGGTICD